MTGNSSLRNIIVVLLILTAEFGASAKTAYLGLAIEASMPFIEIEDSLHVTKVRQGILKDLGEAIAHETGFDIQMIPLPMKRMAPELLSGKISMICYTLEQWLPSVKDKVMWSDVLFYNKNLFVSLDAKPMRRLKDLKNKRVGLVVNFFYPNLENVFSKLHIFREAGPNNEGNLRKLLHGRVDYVVLSSLEFEYHRKLQPRLHAYDLGIDTFGVKCAVSKKSPLGLARLNAAIAAMKKNGVLARLFRPH